ncbi:hypothetical protein [Shivajiella indica]|uniref:YcxB family protein n=1 Tax=Shivajiella indica TaxID=872115 RepID=A0ABW5B9A4_9BACT
MGNYVFKETQRFTQPWIWVLIIGIIGVMIYALYSQPLLGWEIIFPILVVGFVVTLLLNLQLKTRIDNKGLSFSFFPIIGTRNYSFDQIEKLELIEYNSLLKFGGWGIRYNFDMWAYNIRGKHGLIVTLKNKKFLIGTQKPNEMQKAIDQFRELKSGNHVG